MWAVTVSQNVPVLGDPDGFEDYSSVILQKNLLVEMCLFLVSKLSHRLREGRPPEEPAVGVSDALDVVQGLLAPGSGHLLRHCTFRRKSLCTSHGGLVEVYATHTG